MQNGKRPTDRFAIFNEAAKFMINRSMDFQMNIEHFEDATKAFETDAQALDTAAAVFETAVHAFAEATKEFRKATQGWRTASESIKTKTNQIKCDNLNLLCDIHKTFKQEVKSNQSSDAETGPQVNGHTQPENSILLVDDNEEPSMNGDQLKGSYSRICTIVLTDESEKESEERPSSASLSTSKKANRRKKERKDDDQQKDSKSQQKGSKSTPDSLESQTTSNDDQASATGEPSNKSKRRRVETKSKTASEPRTKMRRRHSMDTSATRMAAYFEWPEMVEVDAKKKAKSGSKVKKDDATKAKTSEIKTHKAAKEKSKKSDNNKSTKNSKKAEESDKKSKEVDKISKESAESPRKDKKASRKSESTEPVEPPTPNVSTKNESAENTLNSTENLSMQSLPKNIDRAKHAKHEIYQKMCLFCDTETNELVSHYVKEHPEHEVPIARPSPEQANLLRSEKSLFKIGGDLIDGMCYFCDETKNMTVSKWADHYLSHTGECGDSDAKSKRKTDNGNMGKVPKIFKANSSDTALMGFMCTECNFMKVHLSAMQKHLRHEHDFEPSEERLHYEKVMLVPDLSTLQSASLTKYDFIAVASRLKCTICNEPSNDSTAFSAHFDKTHKGIKQYDCVCGEQITNEDGQLTGKMISKHLLKHSTDVYQCGACENVYHHRSDVRNHTIEAHPDEPIKYRHLCRSGSKHPFIGENTVRDFKCKICHESLGSTFTKIHDHFKAKHELDQIQGKMINSKKVSYFRDRPTGIDSKYAAGFASEFQLEVPKK